MSGSMDVTHGPTLDISNEGIGGGEGGGSWGEIDGNIEDQGDLASALAAKISSIYAGDGFLSIDLSDPSNPQIYFMGADVPTFNASKLFGTDLNTGGFSALEEGDILEWRTLEGWTPVARAGIQTITPGTAMQVNSDDPANLIIALDDSVVLTIDNFNGYALGVNDKFEALKTGQVYTTEDATSARTLDPATATLPELAAIVNTLINDLKSTEIIYGPDD